MSLSRLLLHSPPICQALALNLSKGLNGALMVAHAIGGAMREAKVKFVDVTLQVGFGNVVIGPVEAALE